MELYTWGSPRVGNLALKEALADVPMFRFLGVNDPVPRIPWLSGFYQHCSAGIYLFPGEGGKCEWFAINTEEEQPAKAEVVD